MKPAKLPLRLVPAVLLLLWMPEFIADRSSLSLFQSHNLKSVCPSGYFSVMAFFLNSPPILTFKQNLPVVLGCPHLKSPLNHGQSDLAIQLLLHGRAH
jgi:hypothetical protein